LLNLHPLKALALCVGCVRVVMSSNHGPTKFDAVLQMAHNCNFNMLLTRYTLWWVDYVHPFV